MANRYFSPDHSATSQILSDLAFRCSEGGHLVAVVTSQMRYDDPQAELPPRETLGGVEVERVPTTRFGRASLLGRGLDYASFYWNARRQAAAGLNRGDVLVSKTDPPILGAALGPIASRKGAKRVEWLQDLFPEVARAFGVGIARGPVFRLIRWIRDRSLRKCDLVIVISEAMRELVEARGVDPAKIAVCPNWALDEVEPVPRPENPLAKEWGLESKFVIGYSGNMGRAHEFETVARAGEILKDDENVVFLWIGGGAWKDKLEDEARQRGLRNWIFRPYQPKEALRFSLSLPDIHLVTLLPSMEGLVFPSKFYGIAAAGRPTLFVGDTEGELAGMLKRGRCGLSVPVGGAKKFAATVRELAAAPERVAAMGAAARSMHENELSREKAIARWIAAVEPLLHDAEQDKKDAR